MTTANANFNFRKFFVARLGLKIIVVTIKVFIKIKYNIIRYIQEIYENTLNNNIQIFWYIQKKRCCSKKILNDLNKLNSDITLSVTIFNEKNIKKIFLQKNQNYFFQK